MTSYKLSLHSHPTNFAHLIFTSPNKEKYFDNLLKILHRKKGNIVLGITEFNNDKRFKKFLDTIKKLKKYKISCPYENYFFSIKKDKKEIYFIKTNEIGTDKGHILIIGFIGEIRKRKLEEVLKEAHKQKCIIIANHPLHLENKISYFLIKKIFGSSKEPSINKKNLLKYKKDFDAIELNSYFPEDWKNIKKFSKQNKVQLVSDSDAHFLDEIFTSFYEVKNLNFKNPSSFKKSLKKSLKRNLSLHSGKAGYSAKYKHALEILFENFWKKIGIIKN
ncbi:MAG: hypothetical protein ABIF88_03990 [archaeon]